MSLSHRRASVLIFIQFNLTRNLGVSRSGVVRPRKACASPVRDFLAQRNCCGTFFSDDERAITLPLWASPSELHLTFQPQHRWLAVLRSRREQSLHWGEPRDWDVAANLIWGLRGRKKKEKEKKSSAARTSDTPQTFFRSHLKAVRHQDALLGQSAQVSWQARLQEFLWLSRDEWTSNHLIHSTVKSFMLLQSVYVWDDFSVFTAARINDCKLVFFFSFLGWDSSSCQREFTC